VAQDFDFLALGFGVFFSAFFTQVFLEAGSSYIMP